MRLIDADEFKEIILAYGDAGYGALRTEKISELIDGQSTAYDVDKIVEQLKEKILNTSDTAIGISARMALAKAIDIVKSGGIE